MSPQPSGHVAPAATSPSWDGRVPGYEADEAPPYERPNYFDAADMTSERILLFYNQCTSSPTAVSLDATTRTTACACAVVEARAAWRTSRQAAAPLPAVRTCDATSTLEIIALMNDCLQTHLPARAGASDFCGCHTDALRGNANAGDGRRCGIMAEHHMATNQIITPRQFHAIDVRDDKPPL
jgi:hypothetical protein